MASLAAQTQLTPEEYLAWERKAPFKNEYLSGQIIAMSGASRAHNRIAVDTTVQLSNQLIWKECEVFAGDMRVRISQPTSYFYPDIVVACGEARFEDNVFDTLLNPILIVEVLSPSTEAYDRGEKFEHYQQLESLQEYILISQERVRVERYLRQDTRWILTEFRELDDVLPLISIEGALPLRAIYRRTLLEAS